MANLTQAKRGREAPFFLETGGPHGQALSRAAPGAIRAMVTLSHGLAIMGRQEITWPPLGRPDGRPNGKRMAETGRDGRRSEGRREAAERAAGRRVPLKRRSGFSPKAAPGVLFQVESLGEPP